MVKKMQYKQFFVQILKISLGAVLGIILAKLLGLTNYATAGIITILSLQSTKKETIKFAVKRLFALLVALGMAVICFKIMGFRVVAFGVFLLLYAALCYAINLVESISISVVLVSQLLIAQSVEFSLLRNQFFLFLIGATIGVLLNLYTTSSTKDIMAVQTIIDRRVKDLFGSTALLLQQNITPEEHNDMIQALKKYTEQAILEAQKLEDDTLLNDYSYYPNYLSFRRNQMSLLNHFSGFYPQTVGAVSLEEGKLAEFLLTIEASFHECNDATVLLQQADSLLEEFRNSPLPQSREEFEARANVYRYLVSTISVLTLKRNFIHSLSAEQSKYFAIRCEVPSTKAAPSL